MQAQRVGGFKEFIDDVKTGKFPAPEHVIAAPDGLIGEFVKAVDAGK